MGRGQANLVLVGFMATGKSTVGRALAQALGRPLFDTDAVVERMAGMSIPEVFAARGEAAFRALERQAVQQVAARAGQVVATGGGVVLSPDNIRALRETGRIVWLTAPAEVILERVSRDDAGGTVKRPLLAGPDPLGTIVRLLEQRQQLYSGAADLVVDTSRPLASVVDEILVWWRSGGEEKRDGRSARDD